VLHIRQPVEFGVFEHNECESDIEVMQNIAYTSRRQNAPLQSLLALLLFFFYFGTEKLLKISIVTSLRREP